MEQKGAMTVKNHGDVYSIHGEPDIFACFEGRFVALEVKHPEEAHPVSKAQIHRLTKWYEHGAYVGVVESVEDALATMWGSRPWIPSLALEMYS
jgi:Holliday junction resolvase